MTKRIEMMIKKLNKLNLMKSNHVVNRTTKKSGKCEKQKILNLPLHSVSLLRQNQEITNSIPLQISSVIYGWQDLNIWS